MKKKYLFMIIFAFALLLFAGAGETNASTTYENQDLYIRTTITRWNDHNKDLIFKKNDDWGGTSDWYTKTVWLTNAATGEPTDGSKCFQITEEMLDSDNIISLDYDDGNYDESGFEVFDNDETVYLVEKYHINSINISEDTFIAYLGQWYSYEELPHSDELDFSFDHSSDDFANYIKNESMSGYGLNNNPNVYVKCLYDDDDVTSNRDKNVYISLDDSSTKTSQLSRGTIQLPVYKIYANCTASGNALEADYFGDGINGFGSKYIEPSSSIGRLTGCVLNSYDDNLGFEEIKNFTANDYNGYYSSWMSVDYVLDNSDIEYESNNVYSRSIIGNITRNQTPPNGIFFNILPFIIAGGVAIAGIIILKKNSIKD